MNASIGNIYQLIAYDLVRFAQINTNRLVKRKRHVMAPKKQLKNINLVFVDTETTGLDENTHEVIEIAAIVYDPREDKVVRKWERKAAPRHIETADAIALRINGYNDDPGSYRGDIKDVISEFHREFDEYVMIGQNIQFDIRFIEKYYCEFVISDGVHRHRKLELSSIAWPVLGYSDKTDISLATLCDHFDISNEGAHRALVDCERGLEVYRQLMMRYRPNAQ